MTAMGLADQERAREERQGEREAATANRWATALSSLVPAAANAAGNVYDAAGDAAVDDATAFAMQHGDVVDAQEANDLVAANPDLQPMQAQGPLESIMAGVVNPLRSKARATAATTLQKQAAANTETRMKADATAEAQALRQEMADARAAAAAAELERKKAADAAEAAARAERLALDERKVKVLERPKPGPSPAALARQEKKDALLDAQLAIANANLRDKETPDTAPLRGEFNRLPEVKAFTEVTIAYDKMQKAATTPSAAGDLALIFSFMKMLDPGSTVREGEFANAQNAGGVDDVVINAYNRVLKGERLNDSQRRDFVSQANVAFAAQKRVRDAAVARYGSLAKKQGMAPIDVTGVDEDDGFDAVWSDQ